MNQTSKQNSLQNDLFFIKEFYNTFIEKIMNVFDSTGEISSYWKIVKDKIDEEKNIQQLYKYIIQLEIKKKQKSNTDVKEIKKNHSIKFLEIPSISDKPHEEEFNNIPNLRKTPTSSNSVKTVFLQFDQLTKNNDTSQNHLSPSTVPLPSPAIPPQLTITRVPSSINLKNDLNSPLLQSPLSAQHTPINYQPLNNNTKRILENVKKRNSSPNSPITPSIPSALQKKNPSLFSEHQSSFQHKPQQQNNTTDKNNEQPKSQLKRFTPQQIMRMGSIREAEDDQTELEKEKSQNNEIIDRLLQLVISSKDSFKRDTETLNLIHGKFTLASAENCKNSQGLDFLRTIHNGSKPPQSGFSENTRSNKLSENTQKTIGLFSSPKKDNYLISSNSSNSSLANLNLSKSDKYYPK